MRDGWMQIQLLFYEFLDHPLAVQMAWGVMLIGLWLIHAMINWDFGKPQLQVGNGTRRRLMVVSFVVALLQLLPLCILLALVAIDWEWLNHTSLICTSLVVWVYCAYRLTLEAGPPFRRDESEERFPLIEDESFQGRVEQLASQMDLPTPVVRMWRSISGELQTQAFAGGLPAPSLFVSDGILHRLTPDERDAIVGHELAHLANHSLWWLLIVRPIAGLFAIAAATVLVPVFALAWGFLAFIGLYRIVSRLLEYDCDRRAAKVLGFRSTVSALAKIHAAHFIRNKGWVSHLIYATATHPSRDERLDALSRAAPSHDKPAVVWNPQEVRRRRRAGAIALMSWLTLFILLPVWNWSWPDAFAPTIVCLVAGAAPNALVYLSYRHLSRHYRRRNRSVMNRYRLPTWLIAGSLIILGADSLSSGVVMQTLSGWIGTDAEQLKDFTMVFVLAPGVLLLLLKFCRRFTRTAKCEREVWTASANHEFDRVFQLAERHPRVFAKSVDLQYGLGYCEAIVGDRESAIDRLTNVVSKKADAFNAALLLSVLHLEEGQPQQALSLCEHVVSTLPNDPSPQLLCGWCLLDCGRLDEAEQAAQIVLASEDECGDAYAFLSEIQFQRGELNAAKSLLAQAEEFAPGTATIQYFRARQAVAADDTAQAKVEVKRAIAASDASPFALLQKRVQRLTQHFGIDMGDEASSATPSPVSRL